MVNPTRSEASFSADPNDPGFTAEAFMAAQRGGRVAMCDNCRVRPATGVCVCDWQLCDLCGRHAFCPCNIDDGRDADPVDGWDGDR